MFSQGVSLGDEAKTMRAEQSSSHDWSRTEYRPFDAMLGWYILVVNATRGGLNG